MHIPSLILGLLISTLIGLLFHLIRGGRAGRMLLYLGLSWVGFWSGHIAAGLLGWSFASLGPLNLGAAILSSIVFLVIGHWLSLVEVVRE